MVATVEDLRQALFYLATSSEWMLTDSDGNEIRPAGPGQIQPASMQQLLRRRPGPVAEQEPIHTQALNPDVNYAGPSGPIVGPGQPLGPVIPSGQGTRADPGGEATYEVTKVRLPLSSLTDDSKREGIWGLIRELASLVDPAKMSVDIQMIGLDITVTARTGDTHQLLAKGQSLSGVTVGIEDENM
jgi:hypothetical protein